jgi:hypothetical protein
VTREAPKNKAREEWNKPGVTVGAFARVTLDPSDIRRTSFRRPSHLCILRVRPIPALRRATHR